MMLAGGMLGSKWDSVNKGNNITLSAGGRQAVAASNTSTFDFARSAVGYVEGNMVRYWEIELPNGVPSTAGQVVVGWVSDEYTLDNNAQFLGNQSADAGAGLTTGLGATWYALTAGYGTTLGALTSDAAPYRICFAMVVIPSSFVQVWLRKNNGPWEGNGGVRYVPGFGGGAQLTGYDGGRTAGFTTCYVGYSAKTAGYPAKLCTTKQQCLYDPPPVYLYWEGTTPTEDVVFNENLGSGDGVSTANRNYAVIIPAADNPVNSARTKVRVGFKVGNLSAAVLTASIGHKAASGDVWDYDGNQVQLTWAGATSIAIISTDELISDFVDFAFDPSKDLVVRVYITTSGGAAAYYTGTPATGLVTYQTGTAAGDQTMATDPTGTWTLQGSGDGAVVKNVAYVGLK
jgi:hypothetical protein